MLTNKKALKAMGVDLMSRPLGTTQGFRQEMQRDTGGRRWPWRLHRESMEHKDLWRLSPN